MRQEINLYTAQFRREREPLSARNLLIASAGFFALLLVVELVTVWNLYSGRNLLEMRREAEQTLAQRMEVLRAARPRSERSQLEQQIESLRAEVQRRQELQTLIGGQSLGNASGFSPFLIGMARQASEDLSLTEFRLLAGGDYLELSGWTRRPEAVPSYLDRLRAEDSFQKVKFGVLGMRAAEKNRRQLQFSLGKPEASS